MKHLFISLFLCVAAPLGAAPHQPFSVEKISGKVEFAVWRNAIVLDRVFAMPKGEKQNKRRDTMPDHWIIMLRNVKGLTEKQRAQLGMAFAITPKLPIDWSRRRYLHVQKENVLYLRIDGDAKWPVKLGSEITIESLKYDGNDFTGWITLEAMQIDGEKVDLPATAQRPKK